MTRWCLYIAALLLVGVNPSQDARGSTVPLHYVFLFIYDKVELDDDRRDRALQKLEPRIAESVSGFEVRPATHMSDSERNHLTQAGGELIEIRLEKDGDDRYMNLKVLSRLHPSKPYPVMKVKTKTSAGEMVSLSANLDKIARIVHEHHISCHVAGACK